MVEFNSEVRKYVTNLTRFHVGPHESSDVQSAPQEDLTEVDAQFAPYLESHSQLETYGVGEAVRTFLRDVQLKDPFLELGVPTRDGSVGDSITIRWGKDSVNTGVDVSNGLRIDLRGGALRLSYMSGSSRPDKETLLKMSEDKRQLVEEKFEPGGFKTLLEFDATVTKLEPSALASWMEIAKNASKPYFDYSSSERKSSDQYVDAKQFHYEADPEDEQVYINFET